MLEGRGIISQETDAVSDRGGLPETLEAIVFRARDSQELLVALRTLADSPCRLEELSRRLLSAHERDLWSTHVERVESALQQTASR